MLGFKTEFILNVFNLLDTRNAREVYSNTGRPDYNLDGRNFVDRMEGIDLEISDVNEYYIRPNNYYAPRLIQLGIGVGF